MKKYTIQKDTTIEVIDEKGIPHDFHFLAGETIFQNSFRDCAVVFPIAGISDEDLAHRLANNSKDHSFQEILNYVKGQE